MRIETLLVAGFLTLTIYACGPSKKVQVAILPKKDTISVLPKDTLVKKLILPAETSKTDSFLVTLLRQYPQYFDSIIKNRKPWNVQIIYTQINRDPRNQPLFTDYFFNVDSTKYFYPASTVKLPIALLALQKLNELAATGITRATSMITEVGYPGQSAVYNDPQTADGRPSIESYIKKIFLVSDNDASNRLYEFLGQRYINDQLHEKGYGSAQILHRLDVSLSVDENRHTNPVRFIDAPGSILYDQPLASNPESYVKRQDFLGTAYFDNGQLITGSMNFSNKNRVSLEDLHHLLRSAIFPDQVPRQQQFHITKSDYEFVRQYMSQFPAETNYPSYDTVPDASVKFLLYGARQQPLPKSIRIFNKVGDAYGQLVDVAYLADFNNNIEFFLSAAIYCNSDGILNDDKYDYDSIGFPFMKELGQVIYDYELERKRQYAPDLSVFKISYDK